MNCPWTQNIASYHDESLRQEAREQMEQHLGQCAQCRATLAELRDLSDLVRQEMPEISAAALARMHEGFRQASEGMGLRIAEWMTAAAAAVLAVGLIGLLMASPTSAGGLTVWEEAAVTPQVGAQNAGADAQLARWMEVGLHRSPAEDQP